MTEAERLAIKQAADGIASMFDHLHVSSTVGLIALLEVAACTAVDIAAEPLARELLNTYIASYQEAKKPKLAVVRDADAS